MARLKRWCCLTLAAVAFVLGTLGVVLPGLPTTPFWLLTSVLLVRSYPRLNARLLRMPGVGSIILDWQQRGGVCRSTKVTASVSLGLMLAISVVFGGLSTAAVVAILIIGACGLAIVWRLPEIDTSHPRGAKATA